MAALRAGMLQGNLLGIACMIVAGVFLTANDTFAKLLVDALSVPQLVFVHSGMVVALLVLVGLVTGEVRRIRVYSWKRLMLRGGLYAAGTFCFITGLRYLPLADTVALAFLSPIVIAGLSTLLLGERPHAAHWIAVALGVTGMLVMLRPGFGMHWAMILPLLVSFFDGIRDLLTRHLASTHSTLTILLSTMLLLVVVSAPFAVLDWRPIDNETVGLLAAATLVFACAHVFMVEAFRNAQAVAVTPFRFLQLIWAALAGYLLWGDVPDNLLVLGAVLATIGGLVVIHHEARGVTLKGDINPRRAGGGRPPPRNR